MKASGNGAPQQCVENLMRITRGEVPYERMKGIDRRFIGLPMSELGELEDDVRWVIETYEPRVRVDEVVVRTLAANMGEIRLGAGVTIGGEGGVAVE